jgi:cupin fold WbuC family metalloprotein
MESKKQSIIYQGKEIARIIRSHEIVGSDFFTDNDSFLQVGIHNKPAHTEVVPHAHECDPFLVNRMEEVLFIIKGKVVVTMYDQVSGDVIEKVTLKTHDTMVHFSQGHGLTFLKPTILFEVKQGPFKGTENSKIYFKEKSNNSHKIAKN